MSRIFCGKIRGISRVFDGLQPEFSYHAMPVTGGNAMPSSSEEVPVSYRDMTDAQMDRILDLILGAGTGIDPAIIIPCREYMEQFLDGLDRLK